jgi:hypothetical protein
MAKIILTDRTLTEAEVAEIDLAHTCGQPLPHGARYSSYNGQDEAGSPPTILEEMAATYRARAAVYGDSWQKNGRLMMLLFPDGVPPLSSAAAFTRWHLFDLIVMKLIRFANSGMTHQDSIHDLAVYAAMLESMLQAKQPT